MIYFVSESTFSLHLLLEFLNLYEHPASLTIHLQLLNFYLNAFAQVELYLIADLTLPAHNIHTVQE